MIEKISKKWNLIMIIIAIIATTYFIHFFVTGGVAMDKGVGKLHYSKSVQEAEKEMTLIKKYHVFRYNHMPITNAWLEYAKSYDISHNMKIEKNKVLLILENVKELDEIKNIDCEAYFKNKKLTVFEDNGMINIIGVDKNMDTIILKSNKKDIFYITE